MLEQVLSITVRNFHQNFKTYNPRCDFLYIPDEQMLYWQNYRPKCPEVADLCYFGIIPMIGWRWRVDLPVE